MKLTSSWCRYQATRFITRSFSSAAYPTSQPHIQEHEHPWVTVEQLEDELLASRVLHHDDNILILDKPNGVPMHALKYDESVSPDTEPASGADLSITACLPGLTKKLDIAQLVPAYSQNRLYSGPVILAKHDESANMLKKYFRSTRAGKTLYQRFWAVCLGIPDTSTQTIDLPVSQEQIHEWRLSVVHERFTNKQRDSRANMQPTVCHHVLDINPRFDVSLVQVQPTSTKWDLIQLYLSHMLTPALGDHVYSSRVAYIMDKRTPVHPQSAFPKPQVLPSNVGYAMNNANLNASLLHVHCHSIKVPVMIKRKKRGSIVSQERIIKASTPQFIIDTCKTLGLRLPEEEKPS